MPSGFIACEEQIELVFNSAQISLTKNVSVATQCKSL